MRTNQVLAALSAVVSVTAFAQSYYREPHPLYDGTLTRSELRECMYRDEALGARHGRLERDYGALATETEGINYASRLLAEEHRTLDTSDGAAVAAYNDRQALHNQRVHEHNRRLADANGRGAVVNGESARLDALCARAYRPSDRDAIENERRRYR